MQSTPTCLPKIILKNTRNDTSWEMLDLIFMSKDVMDTFNFSLLKEKSDGTGRINSDKRGKVQISRKTLIITCTCTFYRCIHKFQFGTICFLIDLLHKPSIKRLLSPYKLVPHSTFYSCNKILQGGIMDVNCHTGVFCCLQDTKHTHTQANPSLLTKTVKTLFDDMIVT